MTDTQREMLLAQLARKLELDDPEEPRISDRLYEAEWELRAYLGYLDAELPECFYSKLVELAALYDQRDSLESQRPGVQAISATEDGLSQSVTYRSAGDWQTRADALLSSLARFRRVKL